MLAELTDFKKQVKLIRDSGIQFLDFAFTLPPRKEYGEFLRQQGDGPILRLAYNEREDRYHIPTQDNEAPRSVESEYSLAIEDSLRLYQGIWFPLPFFRFNPPRAFSQGPANWARVQFHELAEPDDKGNTWRAILTFDTKIFPDRTNTQYLAPSEDDVRSGAGFALAKHVHEMGDFLSQQWVEEWLKDVYTTQAQERLRQHYEDNEEKLALKEHQAHYLNLLSVLADTIHIPEVQVNDVKIRDTAIPVDLVLDIGNSRSCGILIEEHRDDNKGLSQLYQLQLRDLSQPQYVYNEPFDSRLEFAQAEFGKQDFSLKSGRSDAFTWPTIGRVGGEAFRMAAQRLGTEGSTGISSPKRYLWDDQSYSPGWRFSQAFVKSDREPLATAAPLLYMLNDQGKLLIRVPEDERMPVFSPIYSRSSLMTMMLSEVLSQALMQINSPAQRLKMNHASTPRRLRNVIMTVPPAMPKPERAIFEQSMHDAIRLVWKSLGWEAMEYEGNDPQQLKHPHPGVHVKWDEATCGQLVYLYNETQNYFGGRTDEFFAATRRPDNQISGTEKRSLKVASIDIGGGTTDLVISRYTLDEGQGINVRIIPKQLFREGFKVAGDDILLDVIRLYLQPAVKAAMMKVGHSDMASESIMSQLFGSESIEAGKQVLRQQLTLQIFAPLALAILHRYEEYQPDEGRELLSYTFRELLEINVPTQKVQDYVNDAVRSGQSDNSLPFSILDVPLEVDLSQLHNEFINPRSGRMNICHSLRALCEVLWHYNCDILLLTGRPSRLPGIQALIRQLQPVPPSRVLPLHGYETGGWYPFNKKGCIDDPKSTAVVGAMLCLLAENSRLNNFYFRTANFVPYSTIRYLGMLDGNNVIKDSNVFYRDIDLDADNFQLNQTQGFESRGEVRIGFRQLDNERWPASALYTLKITNPNLASELAGDAVMRLQLLAEQGRPRNGEEAVSPERFRIESLEMENARRNYSRKDVAFQLNTMVGNGMGETHYWLDSGSVKS
ncbi:virulence factor SrfB [Pectobacterium brasiliense]|uniref:Virulence factor SrfB n=1 Tax=Pectobacterium brasiliense TaxID=180957 RepID=A0A3S1A021_9GAMM|nr:MULTISPECIES: virulence factor SrfB [Pectobacterium]GKW28176.1 virulence factor [Pectobacterium carotovorum subsp. carotovorum]MBN3046906.1 virulence factor SrfB [Pectobacterium brasiliense]MBN3074960.1 virulence factor SrfB [Pectobacterium brasiliense]MBN3083914.1 virulence factor SrfB [Pectobacterium brasiliense]MBN3089454.1 virulence factor SrfB [Pectobacterium brasiliense]